MSNVFNEIDQLQEKINAHKPFKKDILNQLKEYYKIGLTYTSNALEGNSLTISETKVVLEDGLTIGGKPLKDHFEALGHAEAYDLLYKFAKNKSISEEEVKKLHQLFYARIDKKNAGKYRSVPALITGSQYPLPSPKDILDLMHKFISQSNQMRSVKHPVEVAALTHKEFVFIHPFIDGNGRVARLLMNLVLLQEGYNIVTIPPAVRSEYIADLEKAHVDDKDFIEFIARMVKECQLDYLRLINNLSD